MLPYLICTWFCIVCGTVPLDYRKCLKLSEPYISHSFPMCGLPHISFSFPVEQFHLIFYDFQKWIFTFSETTNLFVFFYFIHYPYFIWTATPFWPFLWVELSQFSLFECHTCASPFSLCECYKCHTNIFVSPLLLSGHSFLFPFG